MLVSWPADEKPARSLLARGGGGSCDRRHRSGGRRRIRTEMERRAIMCAALMDMNKATTPELVAAVRQKMKKFGSLDAMPAETRQLVQAGMKEIERRERI